MPWTYPNLGVLTYQRKTVPANVPYFILFYLSTIGSASFYSKKCLLVKMAPFFKYLVNLMLIAPIPLGEGGRGSIPGFIEGQV